MWKCLCENVVIEVPDEDGRLNETGSGQFQLFFKK